MKTSFPSLPEHFLSGFTSSLLQKPEALALPDPNIAQTALDAAKQLFDLSKTQEPLPLGLFPSLLLEGFHTEQIWEQLQLRNTPLLAYVSEKTKELRRLAKTLAIDEEEGTLNEYEDDEETLREHEGEEDDLDGLDDEESMQEDDDDEAMQDDGSEEEEEPMEGEGDEIEGEVGEEEEEGPSVKKTKSTIVDDRFFSLAEMEKFTRQAEQEEEKMNQDDDDEETQLGSDDEEIDYFANPDDMGEEEEEEEDEHAEITYKDFFDAPKRKFHDPSGPSNMKKQKGSVDEESEEDDDAEEDVPENPVDNTMDESRRRNLLAATEDGDTGSSEQKSAEELRQERMAAKIAAMESDAMAAKKWTMTGEAGSKARPLNSLLEEDLDFEHNSKPVPIITAEMTETLEQMIKRRIVDANFDSVVRKADPDARPFLPSSRIYISDEKSKKSLAEIYEQDYISTATGTKTVDERDEAMQKQHEEIDGLMSELFGKLDALSNFHFTPKLPKMEFTVKSNLPAIAMEEAIPVAVADGTLLAPEEVYEKTQRRDLDGKASTELTDAQRKKLRSVKKRDKRKERTLKEKERKVVERMNPTHHTPSKQKALASLVGQSNVTFIDKDGVKKTAVKGKANSSKERLVGKTVLRDQGSKKVMDAVKFKL